MNKKDFNKKIITYADRLLKYEYEKYLNWKVNEYWRVEEDSANLKDFLKNGNSLKFENQQLRNRVRDLEDKLYGRN